MIDQYITSIELLTEKIKDNKDYPFSLPVVRNFRKINFDKSITFLTGENGTGKSTLLEAIAIKYGFNPEGGSTNFNFETKQTHSSLSDFIRLSKGIKKAKDNFFFESRKFLQSCF